MAIGGLPSSSGAELDKVTLKIDVAASARSRTRRAWSRLQREEVLEARAPRARPWPRLCCCSARARCGCRGAVRALLATAAVLMGAWGRGRTSSGGGSGMEESGGCRETLKGRS